MYVCININIYIYIYHIFFISSSLHGHLGCFLVLAIVNSALMNLRVPCSLVDWLVCGEGREEGSNVMPELGEEAKSFSSSGKMF